MLELVFVNPDLESLFWSLYVDYESVYYNYNLSYPERIVDDEWLTKWVDSTGKFS